MLLLIIQCVPLDTESGISLVILPLMMILQQNLKLTTDIFLFISHTTNVLLFKFRCNIFIRVRIINILTPNVNYSGRTAPLTSKVSFYIFIQQLYVLNILNMVYTLRSFSLQNAVCFIILTYLVPVLFTFYIQNVLKLKK